MSSMQMADVHLRGRIRKEGQRDLSKDPNAIIQVVVPLLLELNLQCQFHKILVVHIPQEMQEERLAKRDGISLEAAANILKSQLP